MSPFNGFFHDSGMYAEHLVRQIMGGENGPISKSTLRRMMQKGLRSCKVGDQLWFSGHHLRLFFEGHSGFTGDDDE